jgi:7-cyano-7-deazaguanine reductase
MSKIFEYVKQIEQMSDKQISERIKQAMTLHLENKIRVVDYHGGEDSVVEYKYEELIAHCPMTFVMDLYRIVFRYVPNKKIPELKSLKFYLWNYQDMPISHEHLAARIYKDFKKIVQPKEFYLRLDTAGRGEVFTTVHLGDQKLQYFQEREVNNL